MPDFLAGQTLTPNHFPVTVSDTENDQFTQTNTTYGTGSTGGTYNDCGVAFVAPTTGRVRIEWAADFSNGSSQYTAISPVVRTGGTVGSGTSVLAATDDNTIATRTSTSLRFGAALLLSGLTGGSTYNVRLEHRSASATGTILRRNVIVSPAT